MILATLLELYLDENLLIQHLAAVLHLPPLSYLAIQTETLHFQLKPTNSSDGRVAISESDITDGSFVTIDTILPVITLNGINNTIVAVGADYTDPGAAITDPNNPSYAGTITANPATVDTSSSGNKTITYTAPADAAGNVPDSITRIVAVEDAPPIEITLFTIRNGGDSSSLYARGGDDAIYTIIDKLYYCKLYCHDFWYRAI